jgi:hypothetical protein
LGLGFFCVAGGGGLYKLAVALLGAQTTSKNPVPVSQLQACIA